MPLGSGMPLIRTDPSCRATSIPVVPPPLLETARNSQVPAMPGVAGTPVGGLPFEQLIIATARAESTIAAKTRLITERLLMDSPDTENNRLEHKRKIMALRMPAQC